ncbi:unnamed protein product, partial [Prorocentrum cordatum]
PVLQRRRRGRQRSRRAPPPRGPVRERGRHVRAGALGGGGPREQRRRAGAPGEAGRPGQGGGARGPLRQHAWRGQGVGRRRRHRHRRRQPVRGPRQGHTGDRGVRRPRHQERVHTAWGGESRDRGALPGARHRGRARVRVGRDAVSARGGRGGPGSAGCPGRRRWARLGCCVSEPLSFPWLILHRDSLATGRRAGAAAAAEALGAPTRARRAAQGSARAAAGAGTESSPLPPPPSS